MNPWCASNWQSLRFYVVRPSGDPYAPRVLLNEKDSIYLGDDPMYSLEDETAGFALKFDGPQEPRRGHYDKASAFRALISVLFAFGNA